MVTIGSIPTSLVEIWNDLSFKIQNRTIHFTQFQPHGISRYGWVSQQTLQWYDLINTCYGHFAAMYAYYITTTQSQTLWSINFDYVNDDVSNYYNPIFEEILTNFGQPNTRRTKYDAKWAKMGAGLRNFFVWLQNQMVDADQEIYNWYPAAITSGWSQKLGNPKTYPPVTLVDARTSAPNQYKAYGPYLNYVYQGGIKNAISQNILLLDDRTIVQDYAKYKGPPGFRNTPYHTGGAFGQATSLNKMSFQDWKDQPYQAGTRQMWRSLQPLTGHTSADPLFYVFANVPTMWVDQEGTARPVGITRGPRYLLPWPSINFSDRFLSYLE